MRRKRLVAQLSPVFLTVTLVAMAAVGLIALTSHRDAHVNDLRRDLELRARLLGRQLLPHVLANDIEALNTACGELAEMTQTRMVVFRPSGEVIARSYRTPRGQHPNLLRDEVMEALRKRVAVDVRYDRGMRAHAVFVAVPIMRDDQLVSIVRTAAPLSDLDALQAAIVRRLVLVGVVMALVALGASFLISRRITRPLGQMRLGAERFARGELKDRMPLAGLEEVSGLAESMNHMAAQLDDRIRIIALQRNEMEAILTSMDEGVLAVDTNGEWISMNRSASAMLGVDAADVIGRSIEEVVRNPELRALLYQALSEDRPVEGEIVLNSGEDRYLHVHGTVLRAEDEQHIGAVVVLNDFTRIHRLENVRREFVANVSHELRTPITSIKGFVETLLDDGLEDRHQARHFLEIINKQNDRLNTIIQDLLLLAAVEEDADKQGVVLSVGNVRDVLVSAVDTCRQRAEESQTRIELECPQRVQTEMNTALLEEAIVNLIDNAIKYSDPGTSIRVEANVSATETEIQVVDQGCGISREHLSRIFERFYRVDKARSRQQGGTGLGLAIVKHIVHAHRGRVTVDSTPGQGSTFTIHLPRQAPVG